MEHRRRRADEAHPLRPADQAPARRNSLPAGCCFTVRENGIPARILPRWSLACYWRKDGQPIWEDDSLIADESRDYRHDATHAEHFGIALAGALGADPKWLIPAYEDAFYYMWRERRLPTNVDPLKSNLKNKLERDRFARIFNQGLDEIVGYALPLERRMTTQGLRWTSGPWFLRDETLFLLPGDSPMGYRLPLDSLPWVKDSEYPWHVPQDPTRGASGFPKVPAARYAAPRRERDKCHRHCSTARARNAAEPNSPGSSKFPPSSNPPHGSPAARSVSSRATAACIFFCRR